jgi:hypothetical protein
MTSKTIYLRYEKNLRDNTVLWNVGLSKVLYLSGSSISKLGHNRKWFKSVLCRKKLGRIFNLKKALVLILKKYQSRHL